MSESSLSRPEQQLTAQLAIQDYANRGPAYSLGGLPLHELEQWHEAAQNAQLPPEETLHAGCLGVELAVASPGRPERNAALLEGAYERFRSVAEHPSVQTLPMHRAFARISMGGVKLLTAMLAGVDTAAIAEALTARDALYVAASRQATDFFVKTQSAQAAIIAESLTVLQLHPHLGSGLAPIPPILRQLSAHIDGAARMNANIFYDERFWPLRVGDENYVHVLTLPRELLRHGAYPSKSGFGTLQALMDSYVPPGTGANWATGRVPADPHARNKYQRQLAHVLPIADAVTMHLTTQHDRLLAEAPARPELLGRQAYRTEHPQRHPVLANREGLETAIGEIELAVVNDEATSDDQHELAQMYVESGLGKAIDPRTKAIYLVGDFERAEDVLAMALAGMEQERGSLRHLRVWLDAAALPLQRAIACREPDIAGLLETYKQQLALIAKQALETQAALPDKKGEQAARLDAFLQCLTPLLLTAVAGEGCVALPATMRQSLSGGWDLSVWVETVGGFDPAHPARLRYSEKEDRQSLMEGIVTVTATQWAQNGTARRTETLRALIDEVDGAPEPRKAQGARANTITKAWKRLSPCIESGDL